MEYVEAGASATDDNRPEFQKMIERACDDDRPFDGIVIHSYSRFFRDSFGQEMYIRKLAMAGVNWGDDPAQVHDASGDCIVFRIHVTREWKTCPPRSPGQGLYNGAQPPLGYTTEVVDKRGQLLKKKLVVDPIEAETVKVIFRLFRVGDGTSGPLGVKQVVS